MSDTTTAPPAAAATSTPRRQRAARPTVSVRPVAVGAVNAATIAGATAVAAGGGVALAALAGTGALAATAIGARKKRQAKAQRTITITRTSGLAGRGGGLGRSGAASPGSRSAGSRTGGGAGRSTGGGKSRGGGLFGRSGGAGAGAGRSAGGRSAGSKPFAGRSGRTGGSGAGGGHRRAGSAPGSSRRAPLTADRVAAARRKIANRRQPGPRLSDAIRSATTPTHTPHGTPGRKPTAREAFRTARRAVTGDNPKNRGTVRRAAAGLLAGGIAAGKIAYDQRQRRKKRDAARQAKNNRIAARNGQSRVGTSVRRPANTPNTTRPRKAAPMPTRAQERGPFLGTIALPHDTNCVLCGGQLVAGEWAYRSGIRGVIGQCCGHRVTADDLAHAVRANLNEGLITMTHPLLAISEDFLNAAARNQPEGMLQVTAEAHLLPQVMENLVNAMKIRFDRAQEHPLHPSIKEMYGLVHRAQVAVQQAAEEIGPAIEKLHEAELHRLRNPRVGEAMWDVARNRGTN